VGILYARESLLGSVDFPRLLPAHHAAPERAETGTLNHEGIVGAAAAVDFLASLSGKSGTRRQRLESSYHELHIRGADLLRKLWYGLAAIESVRLYGPSPDFPRTPTIAFTIQGKTARQAAELLANRGVFVSHGDFYAMTVAERLGLSESGLIRAGCGIYTTTEEVSRLIESVASLAATTS
jgi:selenocysteine lyase/cysteine desulfurase